METTHSLMRDNSTTRFFSKHFNLSDTRSYKIKHRISLFEQAKVFLVKKKLVNARAAHSKHDYPTMEKQPESLITEAISLTSLDDSSV